MNGAGWSARRNVASVDGRRSENATSGGARETDESEDSVAPWFAVFDGARQAVMTATGWAVLRQSARRSGAGRVGAGGARVRRRAVDCTSWRAEDRIVWWRRTLVKAELRRRRRAHAQVSENSSRKQIAAQTFEARVLVKMVSDQPIWGGEEPNRAITQWSRVVLPLPSRLSLVQLSERPPNKPFLDSLKMRTPYFSCPTSQAWHAGGQSALIAVPTYSSSGTGRYIHTSPLDMAAMSKRPFSS